MLRSRKSSLKTLWQSAPASHKRFQPAQPSNLSVNLPEIAKRYFVHAISANTQLASAVRLKMHGEIKLKGWQAFHADQVICARKGMIWQATVRMNGLPIFGWDRVIKGEGAMQWKLLGLLPIVTASGPDVTRSAVGRMQGEYVWLPSALLDDTVSWNALDSTHAQAHSTLLNETTCLQLEIAESGRLKTARFQRWGDPDGSAHHYENFGVFVEQEDTFSGYTIPSRIRAGWYFGSERFEREGEFFRATIDDAAYR